MRQLYVTGDGMKEENIVRDVYRQIDCYKGHPGPVVFDVTAIAGHDSIDAIVNKVRQYSTQKGLELRTVKQPLYADMQNAGK